MSDIYPHGATHGEELNRMIIESAKEIAEPDTDVIMRLINEHNPEPILRGVRYYMNEGDIMHKERYFYNKKGDRQIDETKPNNRINHNWHKLLVDQKVQYLVGEPITFTTENKTLLKAVNTLADDYFDDTINEVVKNMSNKGVEYLHPYVNEDGEFDYIIFPAEEMIVVYKDNRKRDILFAIRHYEYQDIMKKDVKKAELYTESHVYYYEEIDGVYQMDYSMGENNPVPHIVNKANEIVGWGKVPIIEFKNNTEMVSDLQFYKDQIDKYDRIDSNTADSFDEFAQLIYVLRGYEGQDPAEFMTNLRYYNAIKVDGEKSGVETIRSEIPVDSAERELARTKQEIYKFGQGVDNSPEVIGGGATGPALENLYALLDLKANNAERKVRAGLIKFFWFYGEYLKKTGKLPEKTVVKDELTMIFTRSKIQNDTDTITGLSTALAGGFISLETAVANNPYVQDVEEEMERIKADKDAYAESEGNLDLDDEENDDQGDSGDKKNGVKEGEDDETTKESGGN